MSDVVFRLFLVLGLGIAVTQFLLGWQLLVIHAEFRRANAQRKAALEQNVEIIANQGRIIGIFSTMKADHEAILRAVERAPAK